jgi:hypothetical protein
LEVGEKMMVVEEVLNIWKLVEEESLLYQCPKGKSKLLNDKF